MPNILVIDDNEPFRRAVRISLERFGHRVWEAHNGNEGLGMFMDVSPALVIVDLFMPEREGLETIMDLRKLGPDLPILAVSGGSQRGDLDLLGVAKRLGANAALEKPFQTNELLDAIDSLLAR